ncbi:hypothetical protein [Clostridium sp.]|uniref:hypothetical protein n=1 Tax=Clostridium sp. TaxID=1506 RepID=UPI003D6D7CC7
MVQNAKLFQQFINENSIPMVTNNNIEGFTTFAIPEEQAIKDAKVKVVVALTDDDAYADMYIYDIANVINDDNVKSKLYKLLNDLNSTYKFISFYEMENIINAKCCIPFSDNFDARLVLDILAVLSRAVEDEYDNIIKTIWEK